MLNNSQEIPDYDLILKIKNKNNSDAVSELTNRHTGIYCSVIQRYSSCPGFSNKTNVNDLYEDKFLNIYQWALSYDPSKKMKFGTYVGNMTKYMCQTILTRGTEIIEYTENENIADDCDVILEAEKDSFSEEITHDLEKIEDELFKKIFKLRHDNDKGYTWRKIGKILDISHEGARKIYMKNMETLKGNFNNE